MGSLIANIIRLAKFAGVTLTIDTVMDYTVDNLVNPILGWFYSEKEGKSKFNSRTYMRSIEANPNNKVHLMEARNDVDAIMGKFSSKIGVDWMPIMASRLASNTGSFEFEIRLRILGHIFTWISVKKDFVATPVGMKKIFAFVFSKLVSDEKLVKLNDDNSYTILSTESLDDAIDLALEEITEQLVVDPTYSKHVYFLDTPTLLDPIRSNDMITFVNVVAGYETPQNTEYAMEAYKFF
jgi:hypothetical protein